MSNNKLPALVDKDKNKPMTKPSTPDPDQVRMILEQRMHQALTGPSQRLKEQQSNSEDDRMMSHGRRRSLIRSTAINSVEIQMHLVPVDDDELAMLRSINRSQYSSERQDSSGSQFATDALYKHEYEDKSDGEDEEKAQQLKNRRKTSMVRQYEQEDLEEALDGIQLESIGSRRGSGIRNLEHRHTGYRHEKMRSSTKSGDLSDDQMSGLVYDIDFDCYYNPNTDTYYRLKSQSKSGEGVKLVAKEIQ